MPIGQSSLRERIETYAVLVRIPNLFTAPPDVLLGAALVMVAGGMVSIPALVGLALTSVLLYAGGTTLNDYFDAPIDATERPERPIPSGEVSRSSAGVFGVSLLVAGVVLTLVAVGPRAGVLAVVLALVIVLYDSVLKESLWRFLAMGSARGLNVLLGMTIANALDISLWTLVIPAVIALYIALVTYMAANEATNTEQQAVAAGVAGVVIAAATVLMVIIVVRPPVVQSALAVALVGGFLTWTGRALRPAYAKPQPETVGPAVGTCVLALVVLDAAFAAIVGVIWAFVVLAFLAPALGLIQLFNIS